MATSTPITPPPCRPIKRGEIWRVDFDPAVGQEIQKLRPAVVMDIAAAWRFCLHIVVPITSWQAKFVGQFWMVELQPTASNGLSNASFANAFQIKSVSEDRFTTKLGDVTSAQLDEIAAAVALCIGYTPPSSP